MDPVAERRRARAAIRAAKVFRDLVGDYDARALPDLKASTQNDIRRILKKDNAAGEPVIFADASRVHVRVIHTDEEHGHRRGSFSDPRRK